MSFLALTIVSGWMKDQICLGAKRYKSIYHDLKVAFTFRIIKSYVKRTALDLEYGYRTQDSCYLFGRLTCLHYIQNISLIVQLRCWVKETDGYTQLIKTERCLCQGVCHDLYHCPTRQLWLGPTQAMTIFGGDIHHTLYSNQVNLHTIRREWYHLTDPGDLMMSWLRRSLCDVEPFAPHCYTHVNMDQTMVLVLDLLVFMMQCPYDIVTFCDTMSFHPTDREWVCQWCFEDSEVMALTWHTDSDIDMDSTASSESTIQEQDIL